MDFEAFTLVIYFEYTWRKKEHYSLDCIPKRNDVFY